jgi:hypothetical protein
MCGRVWFIIAFSRFGIFVSIVFGGSILFNINPEKGLMKIIKAITAMVNSVNIIFLKETS